MHDESTREVRTFAHSPRISNPAAPAVPAGKESNDAQKAGSLAARRMFGLALRNRRAVAGVKAQTVARVLKIKTDALLRIERAMDPPLDDAQIARVAKLLKIDAAKLYFAAAKSRAALERQASAPPDEIAG